MVHSLAEFPPVVLTIAGSDSGGGAGIQADLKTFAALDCYGCSVLTAITAQNTQGVWAAEETSINLVQRQIDAVMEDLGVKAAKTGMLAGATMIETVAAKIAQWRIPNYVLDPVMIAKSGDPLLAPEAKEAVCRCLFPLAKIATPNRFEAEALSGIRIATLEHSKTAARRLLEYGAELVVVKGGAFEADAADIAAGADGTLAILRSERIETANVHGTGCTFSAAITAYLAHGEEPIEAIRKAKIYVTEALRHAYPVGRGKGPVNHFWKR